MKRGVIPPFLVSEAQRLRVDNGNKIDYIYSMKNERYKRFYIELVDDGTLNRKKEEEAANLLNQEIAEWARVSAKNSPAWANFEYRILNADTAVKPASEYDQMPATIRFVVHIAYTL